VGQLLFPASVLADVRAAPIILGFFDNGKFVLILSCVS
jgi:hypothetical protein